jgi:hypothetical protein
VYTRDRLDGGGGIGESCGMKQPLWATFGLLLALVVDPDVLGAAGPEKFQVSEFTFVRPAAWEWVPVTSAMRKAQLKVPGEKPADSGEVIFFHFGPGDGGGTQANVERWFRMFKEPRDQIRAKSESVAVGGRSVTYVSAEGTFMSGMPGGPQTPMPGHALLGAIIESPQGSVFVRLTGPKALALGAQPEFKKMVESGLR